MTWCTYTNNSSFTSFTTITLHSGSWSDFSSYLMSHVFSLCDYWYMYTYILNALVLMHANVIVNATITHPHITYTTMCTIDELFHNVYVHTTTFPHAKHITHNHHTNTIVYMQDGFFPLFVACQEGHDRIVEKLIQAGAIVDLQNKVFLCLSVTCDVPCTVFIVH